MTAERELVMGSEIARRLGLSRERIRQLASSPNSGFPQPVYRFGRASHPRGQRILWDWHEVEVWARKTGRISD